MEENKETLSETEENKASSEKKDEKNPKQDVEAKLVKAEADCEHWKNEYYKAYADMANLRKDIEKDHKEAIKYRLESFIDKIVGILDAFDMAFKVKPTTDEMKNYLTGFQYVHNTLMNVLNEEGVITIEPKVGDKFDATTMHAVELVEDEGEENVVKEVTLKGYKLHDHLIRAAMVVVSKHPSSEEKKDEVNKDESKEEIKA